MRDTFFSELDLAAQNDPNIVLITGDLGFGVLDNFIKNNPKQFINAGIAEQNMMGVAAGLALTGKKVYVYSIGLFPTIRCLEQIRNDVIYHQCDVKIISVGAGFSYGQLGMSHHALEDIGIIYSLPGINIYSPSSIDEVKDSIKSQLMESCPSYLRLDKTKIELHSSLSIGDGVNLICGDGGGISIMGTGGVVNQAIQAHQMLNTIGIKSSVYSVYKIRPLDVNVLIEIAKRSQKVAILEEHFNNSGLSSIVANTLFDADIRILKWARFSILGGYISEVGDQAHLRSIGNIDARAIFNKLRMWRDVN